MDEEWDEDLLAEHTDLESLLEALFEEADSDQNPAP